eukprot:5751695-Karenia_brevis.AAC.1
MALGQGKATLQYVLCTDWEELWDRIDALMARQTLGQIEKVKAHTFDEAIAAREQQAGNWL